MIVKYTRGRRGHALLPVALCCVKEELVPYEFLSVARGEVALVSKKDELDLTTTTKRVTLVGDATGNSKKAQTAAM